MENSARIASLIAFAALAVASAPASAQTFPQRPVKLVVPYPPGGQTDIWSRLVSGPLGDLLGQPVVIENRGGAAGAIGSDIVANSPPDGYTIMYTPGTDFMMRPFVTKSPHAHPVKGFTPIAVTVTSYSVAEARPNAPFSDLRSWIDYAKRNPGKLTFSSPGLLSNFHLAGMLLKQRGIELLHVPYKGGGPALSALISGDVDMIFTGLGTVVPAIKDGRVRAIAMFGPKRYPGLADVPSITEVLPEYDLPEGWFGFFGPAGVPAPVVQRLHDDMDRAFTDSKLKAKIEATSAQVISHTQPEFAAMVREGVLLYEKLVRDAGIKPE